MSTERELLYKILFDMRSDINEVKRMLTEIMQGGVHGVQTPVPTQKREVIGLLPSVSRPAVVDAVSEDVTEEPHHGEQRTKAEVQREMIIRALRNNNGRRRDAARELFMSERTLYRRIKELGIKDDDI